MEHASLARRRSTLARAATLLALGLVMTASTRAQATSDTGRGEITKVDREPARLTIRHGELKALDMPAMTMVFRLQSPNLADGLKPGDKVVFRVEKINGQYVLTQIEPSK